MKEGLVRVQKTPWDNTYMMSLMNILTFATRLIEDDKVHRWVQDEILKKFKIEDLSIQ